MKIGIDKIGFAMPKYYLDIRDLATARGIEPDKFTKGLLQLEMSIPPMSQDIVTLGAQAAFEILDKEDLEKIDMIIVGTESGVDQSKASSVFIHGLLDIQPFVRAIEVKEACYGATAALDFAKEKLGGKSTIYRTWSEGELLDEDYMETINEIKEEYGYTTREAIQDFLEDADFVYYDTFKDEVIKNIVNEFLKNFDREELADRFNFIVKDELIEHLDKKLKYNLNIRELMNKSGIK